MRRNVVYLIGTVGLVCISIGSAWLARSASPNLPSDRLDPDTRAFDLGTMGQGERRSHEFTLKNVGTRDKTIVGIRPSCTCTVAEFNNSAIAPGARVPLKVTFEAGTSRGRRFTECDVFYLTDGDRQMQRLNLKLVAAIEPDVLVVPDAISFGADDVAKDVVLRSGRLLHFTILRTECTHPAFSVTASPTDAGTYFTLRVAFNRNKWRGLSRQSELLITTDSPNEPVMHIPVRGPEEGAGRHLITRS